MRTIILVLLLASTLAHAKKKYQGDIQEPPGGARADHHLYSQWEGMVKDQKFPSLPYAGKLEVDAEKLPKDQTKRQRYIMQIDTAAVDLKNEIWDEGYYYFAYSTKEQGDFLLVVHPKYRKCFDDLKKKFDYMQAVVFEYGELVKRIQVVIEYPRQCLGQLKESGSKLPTAVGAIDN